jgi:molybdopterin-guanine dinucleotide biosynthesis protein B
MHELRGEPELALEAAVLRMSPCDLLLIEGYKASPIPKIEIWRAAVGKPLLLALDPHILAIATDEPECLPAASHALGRLALDDYAAIATFVVEHAVEWPLSR